MCVSQCSERASVCMTRASVSCETPGRPPWWSMCGVGACGFDVRPRVGCRSSMAAALAAESMSAFLRPGCPCGARVVDEVLGSCVRVDWRPSVVLQGVASRVDEAVRQCLADGGLFRESLAHQVAQ